MRLPFLLHPLLHPLPSAHRRTWWQACAAKGAPHIIFLYYDCCSHSGLPGCEFSVLGRVHSDTRPFRSSVLFSHLNCSPRGVRPVRGDPHLSLGAGAWSVLRIAVTLWSSVFFSAWGPISSLISMGPAVALWVHSGPFLCFDGSHVGVSCSETPFLASDFEFILRQPYTAATGYVFAPFQIRGFTEPSFHISTTHPLTLHGPSRTRL